LFSDLLKIKNTETKTPKQKHRKKKSWKKTGKKTAATPAGSTLFASRLQLLNLGTWTHPHLTRGVLQRFNPTYFITGFRSWGERSVGLPSMK
jgi:hypothetical protein